MIELDGEGGRLRPRITVMGVGGAGGNAVARLIESGLAGVDYVAVNTDAQALRASPSPRILQLGRGVTRGLGAGARPEIGRAAAEESATAIGRMLKETDMCFLAAGLGGGTGTGAAPVIARIARARGILTVAIVTLPFDFEGRRRARTADAGLAELEREVDTLIVVPNQNLFRVADLGTTIRAAFTLADEVLQQGVRGIADLLVTPGFINLDFADLRTVMIGAGKAMMGTGQASGPERARIAAERAIGNPLLDEAMDGARGLIVSIRGGADMRLLEIEQAAAAVQRLADPDAEVIWGSSFDPALDGAMQVSVIATGLGPEEAQGSLALAQPPPRPAPTPPLLLPPPMAQVPDEEELLLTAGQIVTLGRSPVQAPAVRGPSLVDRVAEMAREAIGRGELVH